MKYYFVALNGCGELLKRKFRRGALFDYARKENFDSISGRGKWGCLYLGRTFERAYYSLFADEKNFPGESFIRAGRFKIPVGKGLTSFLAGFMMQVDGRVIESEVKLSEKEKRELLASLPGTVKDFEFHVNGDETILVFNKAFPDETVSFPLNMKGREFAPWLYRNGDYAEINRLVGSSPGILSSHPINKVREDLGELSANFLWLWGPGRNRETVPVHERLGRRTLYLPVSGNFVPPSALLGFESIKSIREAEDGSLIWINSSLNPEDGPSVWLKHFESFDREILSEILHEYTEGKCRILFIFDTFLSPDAEIKNGRGTFLVLADRPFSRFGLKKCFKNGRDFIEKFLT